MVCVEEDMLMTLLEENRYIDFLMLLYYLKFDKIHWKLANGNRNFSDNSTEFVLLIVVADNDNEMC